MPFQTTNSSIHSIQVHPGCNPQHQFRMALLVSGVRVRCKLSIIPSAFLRNTSFVDVLMLPWYTAWLVSSETCIILVVSLLRHTQIVESVSSVLLLAFLKVPYFHRLRTRRTKTTRFSSPGIEHPSTKQCTINAKRNLSGLIESSQIRLENFQFHLRLLTGAEPIQLLIFSNPRDR